MGDDLIREVKIEASPETVYEYLVDPAKVVRWQARHAELDPRPGGAYRFDVIPGAVAVGEFVELDPPNRLVYTWGWEGNEAIPPGSTTVELTLAADGDHTIMRMVHRGLPSAAAREQHAEGWEHYLARLTTVAAGGDPGPDPWVDRPAS